MGTILDDLYDHEGYGIRVPGDGTSLGSLATARSPFDAYMSACSCGWRGECHAPDDDGYEAAIDEWEASHARPLLAESIPLHVTEKMRELTQAVNHLVDERPAAGAKVLRSLAQWTEATGARAQLSNDALRSRESRARRLGL